MVSLCWFSVIHTGQHLQITCKQWMLKQNTENDRAEKCKINSHLHNIILYQRSWLKVLKFYAFILWPYRPSSFTPFLADSWCVLFTQGLSHNPFLRAHKTQLSPYPRVCCRVPHTGCHIITAYPEKFSLLPSWDWQKNQTASCNFSFLTQHPPASPQSLSPTLCRNNCKMTDICRARWKQPHQSSSPT